MSKERQVTEWAHEEGFRVTESGVMLKPNGNLAPVHLTKCKPRTNSKGVRPAYLVYNWRIPVRLVGKRTTYRVYVHKLAAFQKYGKDAFLHECIRHMDDDFTNNCLDNLEIGSIHDNIMDRSPGDRSEHVRRAWESRR